MLNISLNKVLLIGHVANDVEIKEFSSNNFFVKLTLVTSFFLKDKNTGEKSEKVEWHKIVIYGKSAEIAKNYVKKGSRLFIEGSIRTNIWQGCDGTKKSTIEIVCTSLRLLNFLNKNSSNESTISVKNSQDEIPF